MVDPLAMAIATNVATKIADTLTNQAQHTMATIIRRIREKLPSRPAQLGEVATLDATVAVGDASAVSCQPFDFPACAGI